MADDDSRTAVEQDPDGGAARLPDGDQQGQDDATDWKAEARKWERQSKANAEAAEKLAALEESQKSEQQKLAERAEAAERRAAEAEVRVLRADVAAAKGVPAALAQRLVGATREELEADADTLLQTINAQSNGKRAPVPADAVAGVNRQPDSRAPRDIFASMVSGG